MEPSPGRIAAIYREPVPLVTSLSAAGSYVRGSRCPPSVILPSLDPLFLSLFPSSHIPFLQCSLLSFLADSIRTVFSSDSLLLSFSVVFPHCLLHSVCYPSHIPLPSVFFCPPFPFLKRSLPSLSPFIVPIAVPFCSVFAPLTSHIQCFLLLLFPPVFFSFPAPAPSSSSLITTEYSPLHTFTISLCLIATLIFPSLALPSLSPYPYYKILH